MLLMKVTVPGKYAGISMFVLHVTHHRMVKQTAHICDRNPQDLSKALHHKQVHFFVAGEIQEGVPCSEEADINEFLFGRSFY